MRATVVAVIFVPLAAAFSLQSLDGELFLGDSCKLSDGREGRCGPLSGCPAAKQDLQSGRMPSICFYESFEPVVCCPEPAPEKLSKSREKCDEYGKLVFSWERPPILLPGTKPIRKDSCVTSGSPFIYGGEQALSREFPHMAAIGFGDEKAISWWCGGTLISERFVLTAAHCLHSRSKGKARWVRLGDLNLNSTQDKSRPQQHSVVELIPHPEYLPYAHYHDIGLLRLATDVTFDEYVRPACVHVEKDIPTENGLASGWGRYERFNYASSDHLMKVHLPIHPGRKCEDTYKTLVGSRKLSRGFEDDSMVCAGDLSGKKDTCQGDSGGPLQLRLEKPYCMYDVFGLTSFGTECGSVDSPAVYTRVSKYVPWIENIVWP